jgi:tetratricopeptide (TPR) repeat protein
MKHLRRIGLVLVFVLTVVSAFSAQDPSVLLEKAIYTEETLGNLSDAIGIYQQVAAAAEADRATAALALYRLGICYQKSGREQDALAAFAKLAKVYPEQKDLIAKIPGEPSKGLEFQPAPWVDGEVLRMGVKVRSGSQAGTQFYYISSVQESGKTLWKLWTVDGNVGITQHTTVLMDAADFSPTTSIQDSGSYGIFQALFSPQQVEIVTTRQKSVARKQIPLDRAVYDYAQLAYLLRCLPLREGFQAGIRIVVSEKASIWDAKIAVAARENVTVPAGTFECFKTTVERAGQKTTYWISTDAHSYIVKEDQAGITTLELTSIDTAENGKPVYYADNKTGISLEAPPGWLIGSADMGSEHLTSFFGPGAEAEGSMIFVARKQNEPDNTSLDEEADKKINREQKQYKEFAVRPDSRETTTVSGFNAVRYIADFKQLSSEEDTVRYQFILASPTRWYEIRFETGKENFEMIRPALDAILSSLRLQ